MIAIYCRQSVDKKDSISIEQQEQSCRRLLSGNDEYRVFSDKGYTGANTNRPQFESMMRSVRAGTVSKVIVYKVDRISRSLLDFVGIYGVFERHGVEFLSCSEQFDTSNAMGKATLQIIMVFAELERNMIQKRVTDNFYERAKKGLYLAGAAPFGFRKKKAVIDGINTSALEKDTDDKVQAVRFMYESFLSGKSLGETAALLNNRGVSTVRGRSFSAVSVGRILRNTVYVRADADVFEYLKGKGAQINQPIELFTGQYGCIVYGSRKNKTKRKFTDLHGEYVQLCRHEGFISPGQWLAVQRRLDGHRRVSNSGRGTNTWLTGLTRCSFCGRGVSVVNGQRNGKRYINCGGRKEHKCSRRSGGISFDAIESAVGRSLERMVREFPFISPAQDTEIVCKENSLKIQLSKNTDEIQALTARVTQANEALMKYINERIDALESENGAIYKKLALMRGRDMQAAHTEMLKNALADIEKLSFEQKKGLANAFIERIMIGEGEIEIYYK